MSLAAVLSAMRTLILDGVRLPEKFEDRQTAIRNSVPGLTEAELDDLAKIPPEKLRIYTQTIFAGERSVLRNHFPITFALLKSRLADSIDPFRLTQDLHLKRPWRSYLTEGLTHNFVSYISEDRPDILEKIPEAGNVARLEMHSLEILRGFKPDFPEDAVLPLAEVQNLSVQEFMLSTCVVPANVRLDEFSFDVLGLREYYYAHDRSLPEKPAGTVRQFAAGGRDKDLNVCWQEVSEPVFRYLADVDRDEPFDIGEFAEAAIQGEDPGKDDASLFQGFMVTLSFFVENGIFILLRRS